VPTRLESIVEYHRARAQGDERPLTKMMAAAARMPDPPSLLDALVRGEGEALRVIAEVKRRSPSKGDLAADLDPAALAMAYEDGGAAAISVLTDGPHFGGSPDDVAAVRGVVDLPVLRKDFTVSPLDICDARIMGASGVLLIVAALTRSELRDFLEVADALGMTSLVEVHEQRELDAALDLGALVIGVNQRDLATFEVDEGLAARLAVGIPSDVVAVAESGIADAPAASAIGRLGYDAVLVGEAFVRAADPVATVASFAAPVPSVGGASR